MSVATLKKQNDTADNRLSAGGAVWQFLSSDKQTVSLLASSYDIPLQIAHILNSRGVDLNTAEHFLSPKLKHEMPDPYVLTDMERAVSIVGNAVLNNQKIGVFGDYDVDGGTSSAIMFRLFKMLNTECFVHIPDRMTEGYGPNIEAFLKLQSMGADILITVDCGSSAPHVMQQAKDYGLKTIILDHHLTAGETLGAEATVNPNRQDDTSGLGYLTAAGVCFLFSVALVRFLGEKNYFNERLEKPNLMTLLDLVVLGTVCDVAPLTGLNRALVAQGLKVLSNGQNIGLYHLGQVAQVSDKISAYHCGFVYGPRINAGGRVGRASAGFELLTTECNDTAQKLAIELNHYNLERKTIEDTVKAEVLEQISQKNLQNDSVIICHGHHWHHGVVGIVASRIKDMFYKPCFILGGDEGNPNILKGSGRSISGVNIGEAVKQAVLEKVIIAGGGHKAAAGLSVDIENIEKLRSFFNQTLRGDVTKHGGYKTTKIDSILSVQAANAQLLIALDRLAPFGVENPSPIFCLESLKISFMQTMSDKHIRLTLTDEYNQSLNAVCFNCIENDNPIGQILMNKNNIIDIVGTLKHDTYRNNGSVQFIIDDCKVR